MAATRRRTRVKVCCVSSEEEARIAVEAGADALGLVARMLSGPGPIPDNRIRAIASGVPPGVDSFLLTSETDAAAFEAGRYRDAVLLDSGRPAAELRELGVTGRVHDWSVSARIVTELDRRVFLAGGLRADNVGEAIRAVRPWGLDLCSGVRTDDRLDPTRLEAFFGAATAADRGGA